MIELLREPDLSRIAPYRQLLESAGIRTFVQNENLSVAEPIPIFQPALCLVDDADHERAIELIREFNQAPEGDPDATLRCPACGEESPGTFAQCWSCHGELQATETPSQG